jgi:DEAD/DEAH box helicase domain-containing protein
MRTLFDDINPEPAEKEIKRLFFDLETQKLSTDVGGWGNIPLMRISVAVVYDESLDEFRYYREEQALDLINDLKSADCIIGFNLLRFDWLVLSAYGDIDPLFPLTFDILAELYRDLGFRIKLDNLVSETIGQGKLADGFQAVKWFRQGEFDLLNEYCKNDVIVTRDLYNYGREKAVVYFKDKYGEKHEVPVKW